MSYTESSELVHTVFMIGLTCYMHVLLPGNIFSSLEGLPFEWSLVSDNEVSGEVVDAHNILR